MRKSNFIKKSVSFILVSVMMLAVITPITDAQVQAATDNLYDVAQYRNNGTKYTYPTDKTGYVFAGWYTDAEYQTPLGADVTTGNAYAKFVSEDVLKLKCQLPVTVAETDETTALRLITSVDSLNYQYVGFKVEYTEGGTTKTKEYQTKNVYSFIKGNIDGRVMINYSPNVFSDTSNYLMAIKLSQIPKAIYDSGLIITPQWVTFDGTTVSGTSRNLKEEQETGTTGTPLTAGMYKLNATNDGFASVGGVMGVATDNTVPCTSVEGKYNEALQTNHRTGAATVLDGYNFGSGDFTISVWFKGPAISGFSGGSNNYLFGVCPPDTKDNTDSVYEGFSIQLNNKKELRMNVPGQTAAKKPTADTYAANTWLHLALVRSGDTFFVYADGSLVNGEAGYALPAGYDFGAAKLAFGSYDNWEYSYQTTTVCFDDIQVYDKALDSTDIVNIKNNKTLTASVEPVAHVTYDGGIVANTGTDSTIKAGLYKLSALNASEGPNDFVEYNTTTGVDGTENGAFITNHKNGPYTVLKGYDFGTNDFTISTWFQLPTNTLGNDIKNYIFGIDQPDTTTGFALNLKCPGASMQVRFRILGTTNAITVVNPVAEYVGKWQHLALVRKGATLQVYVNGNEYTYSIPENYNFGSPELSFGGYYGLGQSYKDGTMYYDEINIYTKALDAEKIKNDAAEYWVLTE